MQKPHILLVEDQEEVREVTTELIRAYGYTVTPAPSGSDGIELARAERFDAALLDLGLPDISGQEVAKSLNGVPIGILTGSTDDAEVPEASVVLQKPLAPGELLDALRLLVLQSEMRARDGASGRSESSS